MHRELQVSLSDEAFEAIRRQAESAGQSPAELAAAMLERQLAERTVANSESSSTLARGRFDRLLGCIDLGAPTGVDNEQIDLDIASQTAGQVATD